MLYVLIGGISYEGYNPPLGVYSTKELAEEAKAKAVKDDFDVLHIFEYKLDADPAQELS